MDKGESTGLASVDPASRMLRTLGPTPHPPGEPNEEPPTKDPIDDPPPWELPPKDQPPEE